jgi:Flp pilus assembly CpaE family ATPase/DNA-binding NarL/FixJ family response regulator
VVVAPPIRVVIVDDAPRTVDNLKRLLSFEPDIEVAGAALTAHGGIDAAREFQPDVVIMDVNLPDLDGIQATEIMSAELPLIPVILISVQEDREYLRRAMQAGARQYLVKPFSADELMTAIRRVHQMEERKRPRTAELPAIRDSDKEKPEPPDRKATIKVPAVKAKVEVHREEPEAAVVAPEVPIELPAEMPEEGPTAEAPTQQLPVVKPPTAPDEELVAESDEPAVALPPERPSIRFKAQNGLITAVFSGKGGVGKSFIASNLAAAMARSLRDVDVALVDLDLQFGDLAVMFGLEPPGTVADLAKNYPDINAPLIGSYMPVAPSGVRVLAAPLSPELADLVRPEHVRATLDLLKGAFDHVIVDLSSHLNDISLEALECADRILMVSDLNIPAIKDAKLAYSLFESLKIPLDKVHLILNRANAPTNVTISQLESHLHTQVMAAIPSQGKIVLQAIHKAVPVVELYPDSEISQKMGELVTRLVPSASSKRDRPPDGARRKFWGRKSAS